MKDKLNAERIEAEIAAYRAELEKRKAKARAAGAGAGTTALNQLEALEEKLSAAEESAKELKSSAEEKSSRVREAVTAAMNAFKDSYEKDSNTEKRPS